MPLIKCKMCGGDLRIEEGSTVCECEYCGTRQTVPSADNEKKLTLFSRAGRLLRACEFDKAAGVFETIVADFPEEAEAYWGLVLCKYGIEYVDDPATGKKIPTCHRSSFDSVLDDPNFEQACENTDALARRVYRDEARQIEDLRKRIIEVSGKEEPYDVFISYKETDEGGDRTLDSVIAQDIYTELTEKGYRVFFSRISLEDKLGTEYEPYIFAALNSAKVMLVVGTDYENFDSVWVKNEWSRFLKLIASGQKKTLIPVFKNMDAYDMPKEFAKLAAQDMGKVGAMQDLVRGVDKLVRKKTEPTKENVKETVVVQQLGDGTARITAAMDRGFMALEDGEWDKAVSFFDQALSLDAKNARAYYGMALAKSQCRDTDVYINMLSSGTPRAENIELPRDEKHIREAAEKYAVPGYLSAEEIRALYDYKPSYHSTLQSQKQLSAQAKKKYESDRNLTRARQFAASEFKTELEDMRKKLFERLDKAIRDTEESSEKAKQQAEKTYNSFLTNKDRLAEEKCREAEVKREADYQDAMQRFERANSIENYQNTKPLFIGLTPYKNSAEMAKRCDEEVAQIEREADEEAERKRKAEAEEAERKRKAEAEEAERQRVAREREEKVRKAKKKRLTIEALLTLVLTIAAFFTYTEVFVPRNVYKDAEALLTNGNSSQAAIAFCKLDGYKDARNRGLALWDEIAPRDNVAAGVGHTVGLKAGGTVVAVGSNDSGQCGVSGWTDIVAVAAGDYHTVGLKADGTVVATGKNDEGQCDVSGWTDIVAVAAGYDHTVGLKSDGTVVAVGNLYGQSDISRWRDIVEVAARDYHTVGLKSDGSVVAVGSNLYGQCDISRWKDIVAIVAGNGYTVGLMDDGTVAATGKKGYGQCDVSGWTNIVAVAAGASHTVGLKADGTVVATGRNVEGQCDVSGWKNIKLPEARATEINPKADTTFHMKAEIGVEVEDAQGTGARVISIVSGGPADNAGIKTEDIVTEIGGLAITSRSVFDQAFDPSLPYCKAGKPVDIIVSRHGEIIKVTVTPTSSALGISDIRCFPADTVNNEDIPLLFIEAIGDLNTSSSFTWYKDIGNGFSRPIDNLGETSLHVTIIYDEKTKTYTSTLAATGNYDKDVGTYYCVVKDNHGWTIRSNKVDITE